MKAVRAREQCTSGLFTGNLTAVCERTCIHQHSTPQHSRLARTEGMCECMCASFCSSAEHWHWIHTRSRQNNISVLYYAECYLMSRGEKSKLQLALFMKTCLMARGVPVRGSFKQQVYQCNHSISLYWIKCVLFMSRHSHWTAITSSWFANEKVRQSGVAVKWQGEPRGSDSNT